MWGDDDTTAEREPRWGKPKTANSQKKMPDIALKSHNYCQTRYKQACRTLCNVNPRMRVFVDDRMMDDFDRFTEIFATKAWHEDECEPAIRIDHAPSVMTFAAFLWVTGIDSLPRKLSIYSGESIQSGLERSLQTLNIGTRATKTGQCIKVFHKPNPESAMVIEFRSSKLD